MPLEEILKTMSEEQKVEAIVEMFRRRDKQKESLKWWEDSRKTFNIMLAAFTMIMIPLIVFLVSLDSKTTITEKGVLENKSDIENVSAKLNDHEVKLSVYESKLNTIIELMKDLNNKIEP